MAASLRRCGCFCQQLVDVRALLVHIYAGMAPNCHPRHGVGHTPDNGSYLPVKLRAGSQIPSVKRTSSHILSPLVRHNPLPP